MTDEEKAIRLKELEYKTTLTNDEMMEKIKLSPKGRYKLLPNLTSLNLINLEIAFDNIKEINNRISPAIEKGFYIEAISLIIMATEIHLRSYITARKAKTPEEINNIYYIQHENKSTIEIDKKTFGVLISECEKIGFEISLINKLRDFNKYRIDAVHKFALGSIKYEDLQDICKNYCKLPKEILIYVGNAIGIPIVIDDPIKP